MILILGEKHELVPTKEINVLGKSVSTPSIVVHIAEDEGIPQIVYPANYQKANNAANAKTKKIKGTRWAITHSNFRTEIDLIQ